MTGSRLQLIAAAVLAAALFATGDNARFQQTLARVGAEIKKDVDKSSPVTEPSLPGASSGNSSSSPPTSTHGRAPRKRPARPSTQASMAWQTPAKYVGFTPANPMQVQRIVQVVYNEP